MTTLRAAAAGAGAALVAAAATVAVSPATSTAEPDGHQVTYTVTVTSELKADVYYIEADPPNKAAYDAEPSRYLREVRRTPISPDQPLVYTVTLADPGSWALVEASGVLRTNPEFHCEIAVDGEVVVSQQGGSGVRCSTQAW